ncbi:MAG TPA: MFS transporter [Anaerolineales bacterium]|nr:MFS transporter [Anaerolineales bacterium]
MKNATFAIFRNRNFTRMWIGQLISEMGASVTTLASSLYIYQITGSALNVGLMLMATVAPSPLIGLIAGVFVDRLDRKRILLVADVLQALCTFALPFLLPANIAWLYILVISVAALKQFYGPAHASVLSEIATEEELNAANSMMAIGYYLALIVGFTTAGWIVANLPVVWAFYINTATYLLSAIFISSVHVPAIPQEAETDVKSVYTNLRAGVGLITRTEVLRSLFLLFFPISLAAGYLDTLRLPFSLENLGATEFQYSFIESAGLFGIVIAGFFLARVGDRLREGQWLAISFIGYGLTSMTFSLLNKVPLAVILLAIEGFIFAPSAIVQTVVIQRQTPREARGRVFSAFFVMRDTLYMAGTLLAGLADVFGARGMYLAGGTLVFLMGAVSLSLPGFKLSRAEWRRAITLLRTAPTVSTLGLGRRLYPADFHRLGRLIPAIAALPPEKQARLQETMTYYETPVGATIICKQEASDAAFFILEGEAMAGREENGEYRELEVLRAGDFFGEIAALTGLPRTANVVAIQPATLIQVPASTLREMAQDPQLDHLFTHRMTERMTRMNLLEVMRHGHFDHQALRELRTPKAQENVV